VRLGNLQSGRRKKYVSTPYSFYLSMTPPSHIWRFKDEVGWACTNLVLEGYALASALLFFQPF